MVTEGPLTNEIPAAAIYLNYQGHDVGAFSHTQIQNLIRAGLLSYQTLAWMDGHADWKPLSELIGTPVPPAAPGPLQSNDSRVHPVLDYFVPSGRIGRITYFLRNLLNFGVTVLLAMPISNSQDDIVGIWGCVVLVLWGYLWLVTTSKRLHDLGASAWLSFFAFIPLIPLLLLCLSGNKGSNKYGPEPNRMLG